ncbi:MAG: hypothetical protein ACLU5F_05250 [Anaerovoracaceae bacterium]
MKGKEEKHYEKLLKERIGEALRQREKEEKVDRETLEKWKQEADREGSEKDR